MIPKYPEFIGAGTFSGNRQIGFHAHNGIELILVTKGVCRIDVGEMKLNGANGTLFILPGKIPHNQVNDSEVGTIYVSFKSPLKFNHHPRTLQADSWISQWLSDICVLSEKTNIKIDEIAYGLLCSIVNRIEQLEKIKHRQLELHPSLVRALQHIEHNLEKALTLEDIAQAAGISKSFLSSIFKQQLNTGPINYSISLKMNLAKRMLRNSYLSIKEISGKCGFQDDNYFCRTFRKYFHISPGQYRQSQSH